METPVVRRGTRIAVVGINYAPETSGIAPYTTEMCEFLASTGADVTVITGVPHYPEWRVTHGYDPKKVTIETIDQVRIIRVPHYVPPVQSVKNRARYEASFLANGLRATRNIDADMVIGITPALADGVIAARLAHRLSVPFGMIIQDLMGAAASQSGISGGSRVARLTGRLERSTVSRADRIAVIAPGFSRALVRQGIPAESIDWLRNHSHVTASSKTTAQAREALGWPEGKYLVVHTGNQGMKQGLENVIEAARLMPTESAVQFILVGDGNQRSKLEREAEGLDNVTFVDPLSEAVYPDALAAADVLLMNERPGVVDMSLPSKLTSYFAAGRPVVAAVSPAGETAHELERAGTTAIVASGAPAELAQLLDDLATGRRDCTADAAAGKAYADAQLSRDAARTRLLAFIDSLAASRP